MVPQRVDRMNVAPPFGGASFLVLLLSTSTSFRAAASRTHGRRKKKPRQTRRELARAFPWWLRVMTNTNTAPPDRVHIAIDPELRQRLRMILTARMEADDGRQSPIRQSRA